MEHTFKIGDRVYRQEVSRGWPGEGKTGTVKYIEGMDSSIGVEFDENVGGHDLGGYCTYGHGWFVSAEDLSLVEEYEPISEEDFLSIFN